MKRLCRLFCYGKDRCGRRLAGVAAAGKAMATQAAYPAYAGADKMAQAGSRRLVPFINKIVPVAKRWVMPHLNPSAVVTSFMER